MIGLLVNRRGDKRALGVSLGCGLGVPFVATEPVPRAQSLALFDALASAEKALHANPGKHGEIPAFELDSTLRFDVNRLND
ncbi:hypothetical protein [Nonomuraea sp. B19D2]|uniref:hypothetical protein n=1 Tax=Nonomuraea sp. B19D2 TaxID=3159561 RepID=UPI0032DAA13F